MKTRIWIVLAALTALSLLCGLPWLILTRPTDYNLAFVNETNEEVVVHFFYTHKESTAYVDDNPSGLKLGVGKREGPYRYFYRLRNAKDVTFLLGATREGQAVDLQSFTGFTSDQLRGIEKTGRPLVVKMERGGRIVVRAP